MTWGEHGARAPLHMQNLSRGSRIWGVAITLELGACPFRPYQHPSNACMVHFARRACDTTQSTGRMRAGGSIQSVQPFLHACGAPCNALKFALSHVERSAVEAVSAGARALGVHRATRAKADANRAF